MIVKRNRRWIVPALALLILAPTVQLKPRFEFYRVARDTAARVFAQKAREAFAKIGLRR